MKVTTAHARSVLGPNQLGYCVRGMKEFANRYNLDFRQFCEEGIDEEILLATGDELAKLAVAEAHKDVKE